MKYTVNLANNLRTLIPDLPTQIDIQTDEPLTIFEIANQAGIPDILIVGGIIDGKLQPLDQPIEQGNEIVLLGPVAGG